MVRFSGSVCLSLLLTLALAAPLAADAVWPFEENGGRFDASVRYVARTKASDVFVTSDGTVVHSLQGRNGQRWSLVERVENAAPRVVAGEPANVPVHVFHGSIARKLQTYDTVRFPASRGIASELRLRDRGVERVFELAPGMAGESVHVRYDGATKLALAKDGSLHITTGIGALRLTAPIAWQESGAQKTPVAVTYRLERNGYSFRLGAHDTTRPVIIDPLLQSTYVGAAGSEQVWAVAPTATRVYVAGPAGPGFPGTAGGAQTTSTGDEAFVAMYTRDLKTLVQATYYGGSGTDLISTMVVTADAVFVGGQSTSPNLPAAATGAISTFAGGADPDGFIARLTLDLTSIVRTTYFGGVARDTLHGIEVSGTDVYGAGITWSSALPGTAGAAQTTLQGETDGFVVRFSSDLTTLHRATFLGGTEDETVICEPAVTADSVYITGSTNSHDIPNTAGGAQPSLDDLDLSDAGFVSRLNRDLSQVVQSTYYAVGFSHEFPFQVKTGFGDVFIMGRSAGDLLPGTSGGALQHPGGFIDLFVARFNPALTSVVNATYFGGPDDEEPGQRGLLITADGVYIAGGTSSPTMPGTAGAIQETKMQPADSTSDAFVAGFTPDLATLIGSTYLGSPINEWANALGAYGDVIYVGGVEDSDGFPGTTGGASENFGGGFNYDGFLAAVTGDLKLVAPPPNVSISDVSLAEGNGGSTLFNFVVSLDSAPSSNVQVTVQSAYGTATAGDFLSVPPTVLTFTPFGPLSQTVTVQVQGDLDVEPDELFTMVLSAPNGVTIEDGTGTGTILNDDAVVPPDVAGVPTASEAMLAALVAFLAILGAVTLRS